MPYLDLPTARLFYDDVGDGPPIITTHGLLETSAYWTLGGVAGRLSLSHRVVSLDLRGHGRSTDGIVGSMTPEAVGADIDALADHLGFERFHLLTHATGGMAGARYAMTRSERLLSLILTDTASQTVFGDPAGYDVLARTFEQGRWPSLHDDLAGPLGVFLFRLEVHPERDRLTALIRQMYETNAPATMGRFVREFYTDDDPRIDGLHRIECPTLVLAGEYDKGLLKPSRLMAAEIPGAELVIVPDIGHMTALEGPAATGDHLVAFLGSDAVLARSAAS